MRKSSSLSRKLIASGAVFLMLALLCVGATTWVAWQLKGGAAAVNEAGRLRMQTYRLALAVSEGRRDRIEAFVDEFDRSLGLLRDSDPQRPLFVPWDDKVSAAFDAAHGRWRAVKATWTNPSGTQAVDPTGQADALATDIERFVRSIESRMAGWTSLMQLLQMGMLALAVAAAVVLLSIAYVIVLEPVERLERGLADLESGDLAARVDVGSTDEFGRLAQGFNRMAARLQESYRSLEDKVREKTMTLAREQERLSCLYDVTAHITAASSLDELAHGFVGRIARAARADAAAIRWTDAERRRFVLLASHCLPATIVDAEACLRHGDCHCGSGPATTHARVIPIRTDGSVRASRCVDAGFATLVTLPVRQLDRQMGEVELFFRNEVDLLDHERSLLEALVAHLATAIDGFRLSAMEREAAVSRERNFLAQELHDSIAQSLAFLKMQVQMLRGAMSRGDEAGARNAIAEIDDGVRESYGDVRELLLHFRTRADPDDIATALRSTLSKFEHQTGLETALSIDGDGLPIEPDVQVQVLHVLQEALSNVRKHAAASRVRLDVVAAPQWRFELSDDGVGFALDGAAPDETHVGLHIMRERAQRIGARLDVQSRVGGGTRVALELPRAELSSRVEPLRDATTSAAIVPETG